MSMVRSCLRLAAVAALRDRAWQGVKIYDSDNRPLEAAIRETAEPYIVVYTDNDDTTDIEGREVSGGTRRLSLIVEFGIAAPVPAGIDPDANAPKVAIPATDGAYELTLDYLDRQVMDALVLDPRSSWGEHFRDLTSRIVSTTSRRGGEADKGARWAARQRTFDIEPMVEPQPGVVLADAHPIKKFLVAAHASTTLKEAAAFLDQTLVASNDWSWRKAQAALGITVDEVRGIGIAPAVILDDIEAPTLADDGLDLPQEPPGNA